MLNDVFSIQGLCSNHLAAQLFPNIHFEGDNPTRAIKKKIRRIIINPADLAKVSGEYRSLF